MADQFRITPRPQLPQRRPAPQEVVSAQPLNWTMGGAPAPDRNLAGLLLGLSALNPALQRYTADLATQERAEAEKTKKADHLGGGAVGQAVENPREALTGAPLQGAVSLPIAVSDDFRSGMNEQLAQRAAIQIKDNALSEFNELKGTPDFEPTAWLAEKRRGALAGISDPASIQIIGAHFSELEGSIRGEVRRFQMQRFDEVRTSTVSQLAADMFTADMDASRITEAYPQFLSSARRAGFSSRESAQFLFTQLSTLSNRLEGAPELFEVFDQKDSEGMTLVARNPQLAPHIDQARQAAKVQRSKALEAAAEQGNAKALMAYEGDIDARPEAVTMERILADMTPHGAIRSPQQAAALWDRAQDAMRKQSATEMFQQDGLNGRLWMHEPKLQGQVLDKLAGPLVQQLAKASSEGDQQGMQQAAVGILQMHTRSGATIAVDQLQRYVKTLITQVPQKEVPPCHRPP